MKLFGFCGGVPLPRAWPGWIGQSPGSGKPVPEGLEILSGRSAPKGVFREAFWLLWGGALAEGVNLLLPRVPLVFAFFGAQNTTTRLEN